MRRFISLVFLTCALAQGRMAFANTENFKDWLGTLRQEARVAGISDETVRLALPDTLNPIERVVALDRKQPEGTKTFRTYFRDTITSQRVEAGRTHWQDNKQALYEIGALYGVDPQYIVALWGIETHYGRISGTYNVVQALATLAFDGRRSDFFRRELFAALKILDEGHVTPPDMKGSWAGAMGQTQFMPSSFLKFAEDYDKDGRRDIWKDRGDVFASAANYLSQHGWKHGEPWGRRVKLPAAFDGKLIGLEQKHTLDFWRQQGVRLQNGESVPFEGAFEASLIQPDGPGTAAFIVYDNYRVIMKWNKSVYFATSVGLLADKIKG